MTERAIPRLSASDRSVLDVHIAAAMPAIVVGGAAQWPAMQRWSPDQLAERFGDVTIRFKRSEIGVHPNFRASERAAWFATGEASFGEFLREVTAGPEPRSQRLFTGDEQFILRRRNGETTTHPSLGALLDDAPVPASVPADHLYTVWAWFSGIGARTWLHYDNNGCHNLNAQIAGAKHCALYAPDQLAALAPFPLGGDNPAHNCSRRDVDDSALATLPRWVGELTAGDLLFIPAWWFHAFDHVGAFNANINYWWQPATSESNPVAIRQAWIEAVQRSGVRTDEPNVADTLRAIDEAVQRGT